MNLQAITVIFIIIFLPIILISNFYIQREMDTITVQNSYDTKLIDATTDAVSAFELNTANEDLSLIPDSLRSICEASTNVFTTTLATNLGISSASKNKILAYIPAIVFTLYDGYYIYSPTQQPKVVVNKDGVYVKVGDEWVVKDGGKYVYYPDGDGTGAVWDSSKSNVEEADVGKILYCVDEKYDPYNNTSIKCTTDPNAAYFTTNYILKSFIPYAMQYKNGDNYDITINYTLDNYISIKGTIKKDTQQIYYSKSGYLINPDDIGNIYLDGSDIKNSIISSSDVSLDNVESRIDEWLNDGKELKIVFSKSEVEISSKDLSAETVKFQNSKESEKDTVLALKYYLRSYIFSCWVRDNLGGITESNVQPSTTSLQDAFDIKQNGLDLQKNAKIFWAYGDNEIFTKNGSWNVNDKDSNFVEHKRKVIKNSIQYNLNLAMAVYNAGVGNEYYQMPILSEPEWDKLLSNVSILAFMQGFPCGLKTYNNYSLITSTKNEIMTNIDDIYYVPIDNDSPLHQGVYTDEEIRNETKKGNNPDLDTIHRIDCTDVSWISEANDAEFFQSFSAKDIKYDKVYDYENPRSYVYDHVANNCYYCIVNPNYNAWLKNAINDLKLNGSIDSTVTDKLANEFSIADSKHFIQNLLKAQLIADAKIKTNTFKSIAATTNYGIDTFNCSDDNTPGSGNVLFKSYHNSIDAASFTEVYYPETVQSKKFDQILKDYHSEDCYEIDVNVELYNPGVNDWKERNVTLQLGNEKSKQSIPHDAAKAGNYIIKFTSPDDWGNFELKLINPITNFYPHYTTDYNGNPVIDRYYCYITKGQIILKSITFKYK